MTLRVTKAWPAPARHVMIAATAILGVSGLAFSQNIDWNGSVGLLSEGIDVFGPPVPASIPVPASVNDTNAAPVVDTSSRNIEMAESQFDFVEDFDPLDLPLFMPIENEPVIAAVPVDTVIDEEALRVAYGQYLVSLQAAQLALVGEEPTLVQPHGVVQSVVAGAEPLEVELPEILPGIEVEYLDLLAPTPHVRGQGKPVQTASVVNVPIENIIPGVQSVIKTGLIAPIPAPASARPVLRVRPANVVIVQAARDVSIDRLVHVDVQGSWPRRLDQINNANQDNIFMQNWGQSRGSFARTYRRLPNGYMMVVANN